MINDSKNKLFPLVAKGDFRDFLKVLDSVYNSDNWCKPLILKNHSLFKEAAIFEHLTWAGWVGYIDEFPRGELRRRLITIC